MVPTVIPFFKDNFNVKKIACGDNHSLVLVKKSKKKKESDESYVYSIGKSAKESNFYLGITEDESKVRKDQNSKDIWLLNKFDECNVMCLAAGLKSSFIYTSTTRDLINMTYHHISEDKKEEGVLHFYYDEN